MLRMMSDAAGSSEVLVAGKAALSLQRIPWALPFLIGFEAPVKRSLIKWNRSRKEPPARGETWVPMLHVFPRGDVISGISSV